MSRVLLVDDSPHAQRMGERILAEEGYEVVTVSNAEAALIRLQDVDPDVVIADTVMPGRTGYEICQYIKMNPQLRHVGVVLTAGVLEDMDEPEAQRVQADALLRKPFEASALLESVRPLAERARETRSQYPQAAGDAHTAPPAKESAAAAPFVAVVDAEQVRAAVTVALDAAMGRMVEEITRHVLTALETQSQNRAAALEAEVPVEEAGLPPEAATEQPVERAAAAESDAPWPETVRRVTPLRRRSGSILGLDDVLRGEEDPEPEE